jgi:hypothetical protein
MSEVQALGVQVKRDAIMSARAIVLVSVLSPSLGSRPQAMLLGISGECPVGVATCSPMIE